MPKAEIPSRLYGPAVALFSLLVLSVCQQAKQIALASCNMPASGDATSAAQAAKSGNHPRVLFYHQEGPQGHPHAPGILWSGQDSEYGWPMSAPSDYEKTCGSEFEVSIGDRISAPADSELPIDACGKRQAAYATVYNRIVVKSATFVKRCGKFFAGDNLPD